MKKMKFIGWIAKDTVKDEGLAFLNEEFYSVDYFISKPSLIGGHWDDGNKYNPVGLGLNIILDFYLKIKIYELKLKKGECKKVSITIEEIK